MPAQSRVSDLLRFYGSLQGVPASELTGQINELLDWVHLADRANSTIKSLSHGMVRRVMVAQAFLGNPELIFLDEPMSGLDPREVARMRERLAQRRGRQTVIISSHVLTELEALCDAVAFIDQGRLIKQDSMANIVRHHHRITYRIRPGAVPLDALRSALPGAEWTLAEGGTELSLSLADGTGEAADVNKTVLTLLLEAGIGIEEIRRGSDLESEYLALTDG
jgi:ABC-type multidrug transport system ATPase subunit